MSHQSSAQACSLTGVGIWVSCQTEALLLGIKPLSCSFIIGAKSQTPHLILLVCFFYLLVLYLKLIKRYFQANFIQIVEFNLLGLAINVAAQNIYEWKWIWMEGHVNKKGATIQSNIPWFIPSVMFASISIRWALIHHLWLLDCIRIWAGFTMKWKPWW